MTYARQALGLEGETRACRVLESRGYRVIERRYRTRFGEIDIVARDGATLVFVEVKTGTGRRFGDPMAWVTPQKQRRLVAMATDYLARRRAHRTPVRFDVVGIDMTAPEGPRVTVVPDAFRPGW